ncbi:hypothetical protein M569_14252 [Genlisea aurea]|uniref:K Homology domain-containing protein n=1 Tax=Genlisea aurea TaxID=192259 RepID=S8C827_9LAMI|nr:hypothetical protein M569_14252 [Genlisea aurea]
MAEAQTPAKKPGPIPVRSTLPSPNSDPRTEVVVIPAVDSKRRREDDAAAENSGDLPVEKRRAKATHDVVYRIVVPPRQIGKVIGRAGNRIQKIREDAKATIKIADAISRNEERVIIITSMDNDNTFCDAENALHQIVSLILKDDGDSLEAANTVRLLIAGSQAGVLGQNIETLRNSSGAAIAILTPCASSHESDRVVQISGEVPAVLRAVVEIGCLLRDNPPKKVISVCSTNNAALHGQHEQLMDPTSADYATMDLLVPENLVGGLIGRFGANISRIRNETGANIKIHGGRGEQTQRQIHLSGTVQQVDTRSS